MVAAGLQRCADLAHLPLDGLRTYRSELGTEEDRASYWRRLIQARLDVVRSEPDERSPGRSARGRTTSDPQRLHRTLSAGTAASRRPALVRVRPADDLPPLPDLAVLWSSLPSDDPKARRQLTDRLVAAERDLSAYRTTLHRWLDEATDELIARYREDPSACLVALPPARY